ncbi:unnamed protein product [Gordionus sp. m RMFG-2023]
MSRLQTISLMCYLCSSQINSKICFYTANTPKAIRLSNNEYSNSTQQNLTSNPYNKTNGDQDEDLFYSDALFADPGENVESDRLFSYIHAARPGLSWSSMTRFENRESRGRELASAMPLCDFQSCQAPLTCVLQTTGLMDCMCPPPSVIDVVNNICAVPGSRVTVRVRLIHMAFDRRLTDPTSPFFSELAMRLLNYFQVFFNQYKVRRGRLLDINVLRFTRGSVIAHTDFLYAELGNDTLSILRETLEEGIKHTPLHSPLNLTDGQILKIATADPCKYMDDDDDDDADGLVASLPKKHSDKYNICPENSYCVSKIDRFIECRCKDGFQNIVTHKTAFNVICKNVCPSDYCKNKGTCLTKKSVKSCQCKGWYLGAKCQFHGLHILIIVLTSLLTVFLYAARIIFDRYYSKKSKTIYVRRQKYHFLNESPNPSYISKVSSQRSPQIR